MDDVERESLATWAGGRDRCPIAFDADRLNSRRSGGRTDVRTSGKAYSLAARRDRRGRSADCLGRFLQRLVDFVDNRALPRARHTRANRAEQLAFEIVIEGEVRRADFGLRRGVARRPARGNPDRSEDARAGGSGATHRSETSRGVAAMSRCHARRAARENRGMDEDDDQRDDEDEALDELLGLDDDEDDEDDA